MGILTRAEMRTEARALMLDTDATAYGVTDTELNDRLNAFYVMVKAIQDPRTRLLSATQSGATFAADEYLIELTATNIRRIVGVYPSAGAADRVANAPPLEFVEPWEIMNAQPAASEAAQVSWSTYVLGKDNAGATPGVYVLLVHPPCAQTTYFCLEAVVIPLPLSTDAWIPDTDDITSYAIAWLAAAHFSFTLGRSPEFVQQILARVPEALQAAYSQMQKQIVVERDEGRR